jgi:hypothetical protein
MTGCGSTTWSVTTQAARQSIANQAGVQEVAIETAGMSAQSETGGVSVNAVPKDGGNTFKLYVNTAYTGKGLQNNNLTDALIARGLTQLASIENVYDLGIGLGGPVKRDTPWFYTAHRWWGRLCMRLETFII